MSKLFDSHAHYFDSRFDEEYENGAHSLLPDIFAGDVEYIINVGTNNENNPVCLEMAQKYPGMYAAVGIHPEDCRDYGREELDRFEDFLISNRDFKKEKIVAIGEIGFDYHWEPYDKEHQRFFFEEQMKLADKYRKLGVRTNADTPHDTEVAVKFGAEGIGLCRTEHMFFEGDRVKAFRRMILVCERVKRIKEAMEVRSVNELLGKITPADEGYDDVMQFKAALDSLLPLQRGDFEAAEAYLHPEKPIDLEKYFDSIEGRAAIDFQSGIEIGRYTEYSYSAYDSEFAGSDCELELNATVSGVALEISIEIVKNDLGYGIYEIDIDR